MDWERQKTHDEMVERNIAAGDFRAALEALVRGYQHVVVGFCVNMLGDTTRAEEVAQEVFLAAYIAMPRFRRHASVRTWLFAIARKRCLQTLRNRRRRNFLESDRQDVIAEAVHRQPSPPPGETLEAQIQLVKQHLSHLSAMERALLMMRYDAELSVADIAHILGISVASVRRRLARALQRLREVMDREA
jgi:RNA polymerase sigma-70 factor (ECF subfamily)